VQISTLADGLRLISLRNLSDETLKEILGFLARLSTPGGDDALGEEQLLALTGAPGTLALALLVRDGDDALAGYGQLLARDGGWHGECVASPQWRTNVVTALAAAIVAAVGEGGGGRLELWVRRAGDGGEELLEALHGAPARRLDVLRRPLPLPHSVPPVPTRPFVVGVDEAAWLEVNRRAFVALPDQGHWDLPALTARERLSWFDPDGFLLHEEDGRLAGFCWTKLHRHGDAAPVGEIYVIGVDPAFQRRGLGRALLQAGCDYLYGAGARSVMLYVDGANAAAQSLYWSAGFTLDHEDRCYELTVEPAGSGQRPDAPPAAPEGLAAGAAP